jgi:hypothetical protein
MPYRTIIIYTPKKIGMKQKKDPSMIDLLRGRMSFSNEPIWFRLVVILLVISFLLGVIYILKVWAIPTLGASFINIMGIFEKNRSP